MHVAVCLCIQYTHLLRQVYVHIPTVFILTILIPMQCRYVIKRIAARGFH